MIILPFLFIPPPFLGSVMVNLAKSLVALLILLFLDSINGQDRLWTRMIGTSGDDWALAVSSDNLGSLYVTGYATGSLFGEPYVSAYDIFLMKYSSNGTRVWTKMGAPLAMIRVEE